jgi:GNAT superfamily N-acetyltransferase
MMLSLRSTSARVQRALNIASDGRTASVTRWRRSPGPNRPRQAQALKPAFVIRVLRKRSEFIQAFSLRYEVYGSLGYLREPNAARLEIDEFDRCALPFGAFDARTGKLIGTLRLVFDCEQPYYAHWIQRIVEQSHDPTLHRTVLAPPQQPLPSITSELVKALLARFNHKGRKVYELSRTIVDPLYRGGGISRALMEFGLAYAIRHERPLLLGGCLSEHVEMYAKYGYLKLPGS